MTEFGFATHISHFVQVTSPANLGTTDLYSETSFLNHGMLCQAQHVARKDFMNHQLVIFDTDSTSTMGFITMNLFEICFRDFFQPPKKTCELLELNDHYVWV